MAFVGANYPRMKYALPSNSTHLCIGSLPSWYYVLGMVHDPMLIQPALQEIKNLGEMISVSAHIKNRVCAKDFSREVSPPHVIARYLPTLDVREVLKSASTYGPVECHQVFQQCGQMMVSYQALESAATAYGATMPGPIYFSSVGDVSPRTS